MTLGREPTCERTLMASSVWNSRPLIQDKWTFKGGERDWQAGNYIVWTPCASSTRGKDLAERHRGRTTLKRNSNFVLQNLFGKLQLQY